MCIRESEQFSTGCDFPPTLTDSVVPFVSSEAVFVVISGRWYPGCPVDRGH